VDVAQGFEVGAAEVVARDVGVEDGLQLTLGFVLPALVDGQRRGHVGGGAAQCRGSGGRVAGGDGPVGPAEELPGLGLVVGDGSHVGC